MLLELFVCHQGEYIIYLSVCFAVISPHPHCHFHSPVAPVCYAHLAAYQMGQFMKFEDLSETSSGNVTSVGGAPIPELPRLHEKVRSSMFFC
jgi:hypothetical protein